jgi:hypothetical protein
VVVAGRTLLAALRRRRARLARGRCVPGGRDGRPRRDARPPGGASGQRARFEAEAVREVAGDVPNRARLIEGGARYWAQTPSIRVSSAGPLLTPGTGQSAPWTNSGSAQVPASCSRVAMGSGRVVGQAWWRWRRCRRALGVGPALGPRRHGRRTVGAGTNSRRLR